MALAGEPEIVLPGPATLTPGSAPPPLPQAKRLPLTPRLRAIYAKLAVPREDWGLPSGSIIAFAHALVVPAGKFVNRPLRLRAFQIEFIRDCYNVVGPDGRRLRRQAILSIARRGGKTLLASVLLLCHLVGPLRKPNSTIVSAATTRKQAGIVFKFVAAMVRRNPTLSKKLRVITSTKSVVNRLDESSYTAISADAGGSFGEGLDFCIYDELAQAKNNALFDALMTSLGSQVEPLFMAISTQASTDTHLLSELLDYGLRVRAGLIDDPSFTAHLYAADSEANLLDEDQWYKANPTLGDYRDLDEFRSTMKRAMQVPSLEATVRNLYLNQRVQAKAPFLTALVWKLGEQPLVDEAVLYSGRKVYAGLDLSMRTDLCALVMTVDLDDGGVALFPRIYTPADTLVDRGIRDRAPYKVWADRGFLIPVPGKSIDYDFVAHDLGELSSKVDFGTIAFDRWRIDVFRQSIARLGVAVTLVEHGQGYKDMSPSIECFEGLALDGKLRHNGHPVLRWAMSNCVVERDAAGNRKLTKAKSFGRIDPAVAALMGVAALRLQTGPVFDINAMIG